MDLMEVPESPGILAPIQPELIAEVERAIFQLYQDPDPASKSAADQWLQQLQQSPQAWNVSWILLQHQSVEVQNFGALILNSKITRAWSELPASQYDPLRVELFKSIARFSSPSAPRLVLLQLCRALVSFAFNAMPDVWPNSVVSCIHSLRRVSESTPSSNFTTAVLQLLTILPEEYDRTSSSVVAAKRGVLRYELRQGLPSVLSLLEELFSASQSTPTKIEVMKCCCSWVQFGLPLPELGTLIDHFFHALLNPDLLQHAAETLYDIAAHEESYKYPGALKQFLQRVLQLRDFIRSKLREENDPEVCVSLAKLVQEAAMANLDLLVGVVSTEDEGRGGGGGGGGRGGDGGPEEAMETVKLVLEFLCVPGCYPVDEQCSEVTFHFWGNFLDRLASCEPDQYKPLLDFYCSVLTTLIELFPDKSQFPTDSEWEDSWDEDDQDSFIKYREDLCDLGESLQRSMHVEYLQHLSSLFSSLLTSTSTLTWQSVEAVLFLLQGVASNLTQQSSAPLQTILSLFPRMPPHPTLVKTALGLLGYLSSWFKQHPEMLQAVIPMILGALSQATLAPSAALAFRDVCGDCCEQLTPFVVQLIPACQAGLANPSLEARDCARLVAAIGSVLSAMPVKELLPPLESLISSRVASLQALALEEPSPGRKPQVEKELAVLSALCHHIYPSLQDGEQHPVVLLLVQLWPSVQKLISSWCTDHDIVESICVCVNRAMRTVHEQYAPLLEGTVELIIKCYAAVHHAKLLDSAAQIVEVFGKESSCSGLILALLQQLHSNSVQLFQSSSMSDQPDSVQAYLGLISAALKHCSLLLLRIDDISSNLFEIGLATLKLPEQPSVNSATAFFVTFVSLSPSVEAISEVLQRECLDLVQYILQAIASAAPRSYLSMFAELLSALNTHCVSLLSQCMEELLAREGFPSPHLTAQEKQQFKSTVLREQGNKRMLREKVKEFALMCRGFHGTLYALETT